MRAEEVLEELSKIARLDLPTLLAKRQVALIAVKKAALDSLMKHYGIDGKEKHEVTGKNGQPIVVEHRFILEVVKV